MKNLISLLRLQVPTLEQQVAGVWNGVPVVVNYVSHSQYAGTPTSNGKARFQFMDGYDETGNMLEIFDMSDVDERLMPSDDIVMSLDDAHTCAAFLVGN